MCWKNRSLASSDLWGFVITLLPKTLFSTYLFITKFFKTNYTFFVDRIHHLKKKKKEIVDRIHQTEGFKYKYESEGAEKNLQPVPVTTQDRACFPVVVQLLSSDQLFGMIFLSFFYNRSSINFMFRTKSPVSK